MIEVRVKYITDKGRIILQQEVSRSKKKKIDIKFIRDKIIVILRYWLRIKNIFSLHVPIWNIRIIITVRF